MKTLQEIYPNYTDPSFALNGTYGFGDKGNHHTYIDVYEKEFSPIRETTQTVLEIGVGPKAYSVRMWQEYFPNAQIYGVDILTVFLNEPRIHVKQGDQHDPLSYLGFPGMDIIINDGKHLFESQIRTLEVTWDLLNPGGIYVIEDVKYIENTRELFAEHFRRLGISSYDVLDMRDLNNVKDNVLIILRK